MKKLFSQLIKKIRPVVKKSAAILKKTERDKLYLYAVIIFAAISFLIVVEKDFDAETWDMGNAIMYAEEARTHNTPLIDYLFKKFPDGQVATNMYETDVMFIPLWQTFVYVGLKIFGSISFSVRFWLAVIGFSTIIILYFIGKKLYNSQVGFFAAATLATSIFYIIHVKSGFGYYAIMPLFILLLFYFFYRAHIEKKPRYLYYCGFLIFLLLFNGWPAMVLAAQIMVAFILFNFNYKNIFQMWRKLKIVWRSSLDGDENNILLGLKHYLLMLIIGLLLFLVFGVLYALYFKGPLFDVFDRIYIFWYSSRASWIKFGEFKKPEIFFPNVLNLLKSFFWKMPFDDRGGYLTTIISPESPIITPFTLFFFMVGMVLILKKKNPLNKLFLIWIVFQIIGTTVFAGFTARNWLLTAPCIALVCGMALYKTLVFFKTIYSHKKIGKLINLIIISGFIISIYSVYHYYFFFFVPHHSFLGWAAKQSNLAQYISSVSSPKDTVVVLDANNPLSKEALHFFTNGKDYEMYYLWPEIASPAKIFTKEDLLRWENSVLTRKKRIVYVFTQGLYSHYSRGNRLWGRPSDKAFQEIHPDLPPKVIYYITNVPGFNVYIVDENTKPLTGLNVKFKNNPQNYIWSDSASDIEYLKLDGPVEANKICLNSNLCLPFPITLSKGEQVKVGKDFSEISFIPLTSDIKTSQLSIYKKKDVAVKSQDDSLYITSTKEKGYVIYKLESNKELKNVLLQINPRINNDAAGKNKFTVQYSSNGKDYKTLYEQKSNKGRYWEWPYLLNYTSLGFKIKSNKVYIKFSFEGVPGESQLWSNEDNQTKFTALGDGYLDKTLKLEKGINKISYKGKENKISFSIFAQGKIKLININSLENKTSNLNAGFYHLWSKSQSSFNSTTLFLPDNVNLAPSEISSFADKNSQYWALTTANSFYTASESGKRSGTVKDETSVMGKVIYMTPKFTLKGELLNKDFEFPDGQYFLRIKAKLSKKRETAGEIILRSVPNSKIIAQVQLQDIDNREKSSYQEFILPFKIDKQTNAVNLNIQYLGNMDILLDTLEFIEIKNTTEIESLSTVSNLAVIKDKDASGGKSLYQDIEKLTLGGYIFYSDMKLALPGGDYLTFYKMKVASNSFKKSLFQIENISENYTKRKEIWASDFYKNNEYQYYSLPLLKFDPEKTVAFKGLWYPRVSDIWIDVIYVGSIVNKYQAKDLLFEKPLIYDEEADEENSVFIQSEESAKNISLEGTMYNFPSKYFSAVFRMRVEEDYQGDNTINIKIYDDKTKAKIAEKNVAGDIFMDNQYHDIDILVSRVTDGKVVFKLQSLDKSDLYLDYVDFVPLD